MPSVPGTLTDTCAPGECAKLPKGCSAHGGTRSSSGGSGAAPRRGLRGGSSSEGLGQRKRLRVEGAARPGSANPTEQAREHRCPGTQPRIRPPPGQAEAGRAQDSEDAPARS